MDTAQWDIDGYCSVGHRNMDTAQWDIEIWILLSGT